MCGAEAEAGTAGLMVAVDNKSVCRGEKGGCYDWKTSGRAQAPVHERLEYTGQCAGLFPGEQGCHVSDNTRRLRRLSARERRLCTQAVAATVAAVAGRRAGVRR